LNYSDISDVRALGKLKVAKRGGGWRSSSKVKRIGILHGIMLEEKRQNWE